MKGIPAIIIVLAVLGGGYYWYSQNSAPSMQDTNDAITNVPAMPTTQTGTINNPNDAIKGAASDVKEFTVTGKPFSFTPDSMTVKKGDTVKITFVNEQGTHDWKIDEFNAATKVLQAGQEETITFVADKAGSFEYYCSVGQHRAMGMKGTLTVTE